MLLRIVILACALLAAGCRRQPDPYAPPIQRHPLSNTGEGSLNPFITMSDAKVDAYMVRDIGSALEAGVWRWTGRRPEVRLFVGSPEHQTLVVDFSIAASTIKDTGPVTVSFYVNDHLLDKVRYETNGHIDYRKAVPPEFLNAHSENHVALEPDKVWTDKHDGAVLGLILAGIGFRQ